MTAPASARQTVTTVTLWDYEIAPDGTPLSRASIDVMLNYDLATMASPPVMLESVKQTAVTDSNGQWHVDLVSNSAISPANTTYTVKTPYRSYQIQLPSGAGPFQASAYIINVPTLPSYVSSLTGPVSIATGPLTVAGDIAARSLTLSPSSPYNVSSIPGSLENIYFLPPPNGTDDTTAIAAGEAALSAVGGGRMIYQQGTYTATTITKQSLVHWEGSGIGSTFLKLKGGTNAPLVKGASFDTLTGGNTAAGIYDWSIRQMSFDGNKGNNGTMVAPLIQIYGYGYVMDAFTISNAKAAGFYSEWSTLTTNPPEGFEAKISNFCINFSGGDGIQFAGPHDSMWWNGTCEVNSGHGIWLKAGGNAVEMTNVHSWGAQQDWGIFADAGFYASNCQFEGNGTGGIWARANGIQMTGGLLYGQPIGIRLGVTAGVAPTGVALRNVLCNNLSTTIIDTQNDGGNNLIDYIDLGGNAAVSAGTTGTTTAVVKNGNQYRTFGGTGTVQVTDTGASGANLYLLGDGGATPSKRIRVKGGLFQILDDAGSGTPFQMTDAGIVYVGKGASGPFVSQSVGANPAIWDTFNSGQGHKFTNNNAATLLAELASTGFLSTYGSATVQGTGVPAIYRAPAPSLAQTAAVASITTITSPNDGAKHVYRVSGTVTITTLGSGNINLQVTYTDSNGTARTCNIPLCAQAGTFAASATTADDYKGVVEITVNPNTAITILTAGTFTGCTYNTSGQIERVL